jgi:GNAT superfamily N-acetyltransferase
MSLEEMTIHPLTADRWADLETLFGPERGANSGCWCMWLRANGPTFKALEKAGRKDAFRALVTEGPPPGLLAYQRSEPVGWCAVAPRRQSARFKTAKTSRLEEHDVSDDIYAITCFFIHKDYRQQGLMLRLTWAAIAFAQAQGAAALDVCAIEPDKPLVWGEGFVGIASVFRHLGFVEIARRSPKRPLMRLQF